MDLVARFKEILPLAYEWAEAQEHKILEKGIALSSQALADARRAGVRNPDRVRILSISTIPRPENPLLKEACVRTNFLTANTAGLTLRYGIYMKSDCIEDRNLLVHEFVHVAQYEKLGGFEGFLEKYLMEVVTIGYSSMPMEQEAINISKAICS